MIKSIKTLAATLKLHFKMHKLLKNEKYDGVATDGTTIWYTKLD